MDTSKKYIKMCEKAKEIQKPRRQKIFWWAPTDWIVCVKHRCLIQMTPIYWCPILDGNICVRSDNLIWLPRQDQLQEMLPKQEWVIGFYGFATAEKNGYILWSNANSSNSMEQLWLAFVMKEKYKKVWNGKAWIK